MNKYLDLFSFGRKKLLLLIAELRESAQEEYKIINIIWKLKV